MSKPKPLTQLQVKNLAPTDKPKRYHDGGGLYLNVTPNGAKSWVFRYMKDGKATTLGLGRYPDVSLADARISAGEFRKKSHLGLDLIDDRKAEAEAQQKAEEEAQAKAVTFAQAGTAYIDGRADGWRNKKHVAQWRATLNTYCTKFNDKLVGEVTIDDLEAALRPIWLEKTETATRTLSRIISVMTFAHDKGWRTDDDAAAWPDRLRRRLPMLPKKSERVEHHPALPFDQTAAFMADLRSKASTGAKCLEFVILTACRSGEGRKATWQEIDFNAATWTVPAERMKTKKEHRVPLSIQALAVLRSMHEGNPTDFVFPGEKRGQPLSDMTLTAAIRRRNEVELTWKDESGEAITVHGFRSSFRDWAAETTPFPSDVVEMALAHAVGNKVEAAYRRGDLFEKRRSLMQTWADYCSSFEPNP